MSFELPLFPLNVVLFPGMALPLHIFEPRYRLMMSRCLEGDRSFGVALLVEGEEGQPDTVPARIGCAAEIIEAARLPDGRLNLQTEGRRRFRVLSLREEDDYLIGTVEWLDDEPVPGDEQAALREQAAAVCRSLRRYLSLVAPGSQSAIAELEMPDDPIELSHWVAMLLAAPNHQKQELLEMTSTPARLQAELHLLQRARIVQQAFMHRLKWAPPDSSESETAGSQAAFFWLN